MDWIERMNAAIGCIEDSLAGEIDMKNVAKAALTSPWHFMRMFAFLADMPLSEYIRRRRLTLAAMELKASRASIVDVAVKYGYDSREAFTRAFRRYHGIPPSAARADGAVMKAWPRMSFHIEMRGDRELNYRLEELDAFSVIGERFRVSTKDSFSAIPGIWSKVRAEGLFERLWEIRKKGANPGGILGILSDGNFGKNEEFNYMLSIATDAEPSAGMIKVDFPKSLWVVFEAAGSPNELQTLWSRFYAEWIPSTSSVYDLAWMPSVENYLPIEDNKNELWIPVVKKDTTI